MMKESENTLDKKFQVLSNRTRREILMRLNQESHSAGEIATCFQITPASISCHRVERRRIYRLNHDALDELYLWLQNLYKTK